MSGRVNHELAVHRRPWMGRAQELAELVRDTASTQSIPPDGTCLVFVGRGGLLLLPAFADSFGGSGWTVVTCSRAGGVVDTMPLPTGELELIVIVDAVIATGASMRQVREHVLSRVRPTLLWAASVSCTEDALEPLAACFDQLIHLRRDRLVAGVPNGDLDGLDAGDLFQGFGKRALPNAGRIFTALAETSERHRANRSAIHSAVWRVTRSIGPRRVLDVGCGDGDLSKLLAEPGREVIGIDPDEPSIERAIAQHARPGLSFISSWSSIPYEDQFDAVVCTMVLNAIPNPRELIDQALRYCAPDGYHVWTILHPAFSFDESMNSARIAVEDGADRIEASLGNGYLCEHTYLKRRDQATIEHYHRPMSWYVDLFGKCGLTMMRIVEPPPLTVGHPVLPRVCIFVTRLESSRLARSLA